MNGVLTFSQWAKSSALNENIQATKSFLIKRYVAKHRLEEVTPEDEKKALDNKAYLQIRELLKGNDGYVYAFVKFHFDHGATLNDLSELYQKIKDNAGSLNTLPMSIEEYSKQDIVNGVNPFEALMDQFHEIEERRKHRWIIDKVNGELRRSIKQLPPEDINRLYRAAKLIDDADAEAGDFKDPETGRMTNNRLSLLRETNAFSDAKKYLPWVEDRAKGVSNSDVRSKINELRSLQPEAGIIYNKGGYLVLSIRTEHAQKELCAIGQWCINRSSWKSYGGLSGYLQYNVFNFNVSITNPLHLVGNTINAEGNISNTHDKDNASITKSTDPFKNFIGLGYPEDLATAVVNSIPIEREIKTIVEKLDVEKIKAIELLDTIVRSTYKINLEVEAEVRNSVVKIISDKLEKRLNREEVLNLYMKYGVLSTFSARILNGIIPDLTDDEKTKLFNTNDRIINDPSKGLRVILAKVGRSKYPQLARTLDTEEKIKDIINSGESITSAGF